MTPNKDKHSANRCDALAWKVWGYVRDNARSLDSETHMRWIAAAMCEAMRESEQREEQLTKRLALAEATIEMFLKEPPPMQKATSWTKAKRMNADRAKWVVEQVLGNGMNANLVAKRLGVDPVTITKTCSGAIWAEETAKLRAKYAAKLDSQAESVQAE